MKENNERKCCKDGHDRHHIGRSRDHLGRFTENFIHQKDIPEQCYLCKSGVHHKCIEPESCGCDCADFIENTTTLVEVDH